MTQHPGRHTLDRPVPIDIAIAGMTCASCVRRVEKALGKVPGVESASVNLATERARVEPGSASPQALESAVRAIGYDAHVIDARQPAADHSSHHDEDARALLRDVLIAAALTLPIVVVEMGGHLIPAVHHWTMSTLGPWNGYLQFALTTILLAGPGR
ncbi:MAG: cation-translocating P-type ATPase, partial [Rhizobiales bacterium]|nr:cation-translocating P-type ATPase [Hyphomicrobiales bacterium]